MKQYSFKFLFLLLAVLTTVACEKATVEKADMEKTTLEKTAVEKTKVEQPTVADDKWQKTFDYYYAECPLVKPANVVVATTTQDPNIFFVEFDLVFQKDVSISDFEKILKGSTERPFPLFDDCESNSLRAGLITEINKAGLNQSPKKGDKLRMPRQPATLRAG